MPVSRRKDFPHRRLNLLTGEAILVSPQRSRRPWRGQESLPRRETRPPHDPDCHLCPGNARANGVRNPEYDSTFVFPNDFPALIADVPAGELPPDALLRAEVSRGECRVVCFSPRHDLSLAEMTTEDIEDVVGVWIEQTEALGTRFRWVQVFENKGEMMGCSDPHPHGQIWATDALPLEPAKEDRGQRGYFEQHGSPLLVDYVERELTEGERVVFEESDWVALVPFWAVWPFEVMLLPRRPVRRLPELAPRERSNLARALKRLLVRYDNLFETSFPYSMGWHGAPFDGTANEHWILHAHFYPPLLRSASIRKFMVGYEMLAEPQRDLTAEDAAERLRGLPEVHYRSRY